MLTLTNHSEFVKPGGGARCVNVRSGVSVVPTHCCDWTLTWRTQHGSKGHQIKNGKVLAVGGYVSNFSFKDYRQTFEWNVYRQVHFSVSLFPRDKLHEKHTVLRISCFTSI